MAISDRSSPNGRNAAASRERVVVVGRIRGAYGIKGWLQVAAYTERKESLLEYRPWLLGSTDGAGTERAQAELTTWQRVEVVEAQPHKQGFVVRLGGVTDRSQAEALKGRLIGVPESALPEPEPDEYYWRDLLGASVVQSDGTVLGVVESLIETGANDVLVVRRPDGAELLIPFHDRYVRGVDQKVARIEVDWPDG